MQAQENTQPVGNLKISREVIATIARYAAMEIEGVASLPSFATNLKGILKKQSPKAVSIDLSDDVAVIDIHINVKSGVNIPALAEKLQLSVKEAVQNMTGIAVSRVNVIVAGIVFDEPAQAQQQAE